MGKKIWCFNKNPTLYITLIFQEKNKEKKNKKFSILIMEGNIQDNNITLELLKCIWKSQR